jgi:hypothetical protein
MRDDSLFVYQDRVRFKLMLELADIVGALDAFLLRLSQYQKRETS